MIPNLETDYQYYNPLDRNTDWEINWPEETQQRRISHSRSHIKEENEEIDLFKTKVTTKKRTKRQKITDFEQNLLSQIDDHISVGGSVSTVKFN